ncbi:MAG: sn-glycerol 3-phosphate transport system permease protein [Gammaproteobacteria bacterium]
MNVPLAVISVTLVAAVAAALLSHAAATFGRSRLLGAFAGALLGLAGPLTVMVPLGFCTFDDETTTLDRWFGLALIAGAGFVAIRLGRTALDPDAAQRRQQRGDDVAHGVFRGSRLAPWLLLAPTLVVLVVFLYWPALRTLRLSTQLARLGAPRRADRCVSNFTELVGPGMPWLVVVAISTAITVWTATWFARRRMAGRPIGPARQRVETAIRFGSTIGVGAVLLAIAGLWTADYRAVFVVTMIISIGTVAGGLVIALGIACLAYQPIRGAGLYRTLLVWPYAISPPIAGLLFFVMFDANSGIIEHWVDSIFGLALPDYRTNARLAQLVVVLASIWKTLGYNLLFYIAGLQTVPKDQMEAAMLDGAGSLQRFRYVVLPALSPITFFLVITNLTYAFFETYGTIDYLTAGGPAGQTSVAMFEVIQTAIPGRDLGRGAAQSLVLFGGVVALTIWQFRSTGRRVSYGN